MKKTLILLVLASSFSFSAEVYDLSKIIKNKLYFNAEGTMLFINNPTALPISIVSESKGLKKVGDTYEAYNLLTMVIDAGNGQKITSITSSKIIADKEYRTLEIREKTSTPTGETTSVTCKKSKDTKIDTEFKKEIGYVSETEEFICDNKSRRESSLKLEKGNNGLAIVKIFRKLITPAPKGRTIEVVEDTRISIDTDGNIKDISSEITAKDLFKLDYTAKDISQ